MPRWRGTIVTGVVLDVVDDSAFEDPVERRDVTDGECGTVTNGERGAVANGEWRGGRSRRTGPCTCQDVADGEHGVAAAVDELARVHARTTVVVLVVKLGRDCN